MQNSMERSSCMLGLLIREDTRSAHTTTCKTIMHWIGARHLVRLEDNWEHLKQCLGHHTAKERKTEEATERTHRVLWNNIFVWSYNA